MVFMNEITAAYPATAIHVVLDNLNTHEPKEELQRKILGRSQAVRQRILIPPCGGSNPPAPASNQALDITGIYVFSRSPFSRLFPWVTVPRSKALPGRDDFRPEFRRGGSENLSGAISWLTFFAGGAANARRIERN